MAANKSKLFVKRKNNPKWIAVKQLGPSRVLGPELSIS